MPQHGLPGLKRDCARCPRCWCRMSGCCCSGERAAAAVVVCACNGLHSFTCHSGFYRLGLWCQHYHTLPARKPFLPFDYSPPLGTLPSLLLQSVLFQPLQSLPPHKLQQIPAEVTALPILLSSSEKHNPLLFATMPAPPVYILPFSSSSGLHLGSVLPR